MKPLICVLTILATAALAALTGILGYRYVAPAVMGAQAVALQEPPAGYCECTPTPEPTPTCPPGCGGPMVTPTPEATATPEPEAILWDPRLDELGLTVERRQGEYQLIAAWVTINGNWDDVPEWAHFWQMDTLGGDHMFFGRAEDADGKPIAGATIAMVWPSGGDTRTTDGTGWGNLVLAGQGWDPAQGQGPYTGFAFGGDKLIGMGMPWNWHYSFFGVWQRPTSVMDLDRAQWGGQ